MLYYKVKSRSPQETLYGTPEPAILNSPYCVLYFILRSLMRHEQEVRAMPLRCGKGILKWMNISNLCYTYQSKYF